jgi:hypothetical protein
MDEPRRSGERHGGEIVDGVDGEGLGRPPADAVEERDVDLRARGRRTAPDESGFDVSCETTIAGKDSTSGSSVPVTVWVSTPPP